MRQVKSTAQNTRRHCIVIESKFESASYTYSPSTVKIKQAEKPGKPVEIITEVSVSLVDYLEKLQPE